MYVPVPSVAPKVARSPILASAVVVGLIVLVAGLAGLWAYSNERERAAESHRTATAEVAGEIDSLLASAVGGLRGMRGFLDAAGEVDADRFARVSEPLLQEHSLIGTQWVSWVDLADRGRFERRLGTTIRATNGIPAPPAPLDRGFGVISYAAPETLHAAAIGIDHFSEPGRRATMLASARGGLPMFSPPTRLAVDGNPWGMLIFLPVYDGGMIPDSIEDRSAKLRGWVAGVYELEALGEIVSMRVPTDTDYRAGEFGLTLLGSADLGAGAASQTLEIGGRTWEIEALSPARPGWGTSAAIVLAGALVALLSLLVLREGRRRELAALAMAAAQRDRAAAEEALRVNERHYRDMLESAPDGVIAIDDVGYITSANPAAERIFDRGGAPLEGLHLSALVAGSGVLASPPGVARDLLGSGDLTGVRADGSEFLIQAGIADDPAPDRETYTVILRDVSHERRAAAEEHALRAVATAVASETAPGDMYDLVARNAGELEDADSACVTRMEPGAARVVGSWGSAAMDPAGRCATARAWRLGDPAIIFDHAVETENGEDFVRSTGIRSEVAVPVRVGGRLWGVLSLRAAEPYAFRSGAEGRLERFTELLGMAIANADARAQLTAMASTDALTNVANQGAFNERLMEEAEAASHAGSSLCLAVFDVDHFKKVNDSLGHQIGDAVLVEIAARLNSLTREGDMLARVGGEEFAWIMTDVAIDDAVEAAERARVAIGEAEIAGVGSVTISAGVATLEPGQPAGDLFRHADLALYLAKARGRNACVRYSSVDVEGLPGRGDTDAKERARRTASLRVLARAVDAKDPSGPRHSDRVARVCAAVAGELGWSADSVERLREAALVHDVGKIGIPDHILGRSRPLEPDEMRQVMVHPELGGRIVEDALSREQASWVRFHHERFDGSGYPDGLTGAQIPAGGRIIAVAEAWDAMVHGRFYRPARPADEAIAELRRESGRQFCPAAVDALIALHEAGRMPDRPLEDLLRDEGVVPSAGPSTSESGPEQADDVADLRNDQLLESEAHRLG